FFKAAQEMINKGVEKVVISRGDKGLIYFTNTGEAGVQLPPKVKIADVTGAGDSLVSGIIFAHLKGLSTEDACKIGMSCSMLALQ
ncbi:sugar kinase, partial [Shouchella clausii]